MASVRMTKDLKSSILSKFQEALVASTQENPKLNNLGEKLYKLVHTDIELQWLELTQTLIDSYDGSQQKRKKEVRSVVSDRLAIILCPNNEENVNKSLQKKLVKNFSIRNHWASKCNKYSGREESNPGEIGLEIPLPGELPMVIHQNYYYYAYDNQTTISNGFCITDPELISLITTFSEGTIKATDSVNTLDNFLEGCTTLKKFLDEWPGAESLVPERYIQQMFTKKVNSTTNQADLLSKRTLNTDFKEEMQAAILTSKLL